MELLGEHVRGAGTESARLVELAEGTGRLEGQARGGSHGAWLAGNGSRLCAFYRR